MKERKRSHAQRRSRVAGLLLALFAASWFLGQVSLTGLAADMEAGPSEEIYCGQEEHAHDEACEGSWELICPVPEGTVLSCGKQEHTHGEGCQMVSVQICGEEDHEHSEECFEEPECLLHSHTDTCFTAECVLEEHGHDENCYDFPKDGGPGHIHGEDCYLRTGTCEKETHVHDDSCKVRPLTEAEREAVQAVVDRIEALPTQEEVETKIAEAGEDADARDAYLLELYCQVRPVREQYLALEETLRGYVVNAEKLAAFDWLWAMPLPEDAPTFTVQYWAYLDMPARPAGDTGKVDGEGYPKIDGYKALPVVVNQGQNTPTNGTGYDKNNLTYLWVKDDRTGQRVPVYFEETPRKMYRDEAMVYSEALDILMGDPLVASGHYGSVPREIWVLKDDAPEGEADRTDAVNETYWTVYPAGGNMGSIRFTTDETEANGTDTILIREGTVVRLMYDTNRGTFRDEANFYDYDITDGNHYKSNSTSTRPGNLYTSKPGYWDTVYLNTNRQGINHPGNYAQGNDPKLAFGNSITGMGLETEAKNGYYINRPTSGNLSNASYGIVQRDLDGNGHIRFNGINAPNLFSEGAANGKTSFEDQILTFDRNGDSFTLSSVHGSATGAYNLDTFQFTTTRWDPNYNGGAQNPNSPIFSNMFWPMDASKETFGTLGHDPAFGRGGNTRQYIGTNGGRNMPLSDEGAVDHNAYFGMEYAMKFQVGEKYRGPLDFYFYGDDDLWVFLDGKLIVDIGGVHSSVGQYTNLWNYIEEGDTGTHTLRVFYTERGASGSSCYFHFTLPNLAPAAPPPIPETGRLKIDKKVAGPDGLPMESNDSFSFTLEVWEDERSFLDGKPLAASVFTWRENGGEAQSLANGGTVTLTGAGSIQIEGLKPGMYYRITELPSGKYKPAVNGAEGAVAEGGFSANGVTVKYVNRLDAPMMPETGGPGTFAMTLSALVLMAGAVGGLLRRRRKRA